jgi:hypothetical protein
MIPNEGFVVKRYRDILLVYPMDVPIGVGMWLPHFPHEDSLHPLSREQPRLLDGVWWVYPGEFTVGIDEDEFRFLWDGENLTTLDGKMVTDNIQVLTEN